jgi:hypothetical protein
MSKWILLVAIAAIVLGLLTPYLARLGLGRLPGDIRFKKKGRDYYLPITSTVLLSLLLTVLARII